MEDREETPLIVEKRNTDGTDVGPTKRSLCESVFANILFLIFVLSLLIGDSVKSQFVYKWITKNVHLPQRFYTEDSNSTKNNTCGLNSTDAENQFQKLSSEWLLYFTIVEYGLSLPFLSMSGVYSDFIGRKPIMTLSCVCLIIKHAIMVYLIYAELRLEYFFLAFGISGLGGGHYSFIVSFYASVADTTPSDNSRSIAIAFVEVVIGLASCASQIGSGYLIQDTGFVYITASIVGLLITDAILILFFIKETRQTRQKISTTSFRNKMKRLFSIFTNSSDRKHQPLTRTLLLFIAFFFYYQFYNTRSNIEVLYQLRSPFCWKAEHIGYYRAGRDAVQLTIGVGIFKLLLFCIQEEYIAILGTFSAIASCILVAFANSDWLLYGAVAAGIMCLVPLPIIRAVMSKMVLDDRQGALFANIYIIEVICTLSGTTIFNNIYAQTQSIMTGLVFIVMVGFNGVSMFFLLLSMKMKTHTNGETFSVQTPKSIEKNTTLPSTSQKQTT